MFDRSIATIKSSTAVVKFFSASALMAFACSAFAQQAYPIKPIRFLIPYAPGGGPSIVVHLLGQKLSESLGQPVIVDNRPGGNTIVGSEALLNYPPDGHTILLAGSSIVYLHLLQTVPFDTIKDYAPVVTMYTAEQVLAISPSTPANNLRELIALAKSRPGQLNYGSVSAGTFLAAESFNMIAGVKTQQVNYKGSAQALNDLVSGQVQMAFVAPMGALGHIKSGRLKALAVSGETRLPALPQVPTFTEAGLPGVDARAWFGVLARAGTPKEIIGKLSTEIARIIALPEMKEKLVSLAVEPFISTPEQFAVLMKADMAKYARFIKAANIKIQ